MRKLQTIVPVLRLSFNFQSIWTATVLRCGYFQRITIRQVSSIDFTVNINVGSRENVHNYIMALYNIKKVKFFEPKYSKNDEHIDKSLSFDLEGKSNGIEFTAYDKEGAIRQKEEKNNDFKAKLKAADGILRVEVRLKKKKIIRKYTEKKDVSEQIKNLALNSKYIFLGTFKHIVTHGDNCKKKETVKLIEENIVKKSIRKK